MYIQQNTNIHTCPQTLNMGKFGVVKFWQIANDNANSEEILVDLTAGLK